MNDTSNAVRHLRWDGPYTFHELLNSPTHRANFGRSGVYLWLDRLRTPEAIVYVGRATGSPDLWTRQWSHYTSLIAGHYQIPEWSQSGQSRWAMDPANAAVVETVFDEARYHALVDRGFHYAKGIYVYLCPIDSSDLVKKLERQLLFELCPLETSSGTKTQPSEFVNLLHENATWLTPATRKQIRDSVNFA